MRWLLELPILASLKLLAAGKAGEVKALRGELDGCLRLRIGDSHSLPATAPTGVGSGDFRRNHVVNFFLIRLQIKATNITKRLKAIGMPEKNIQTCLNDFASSAASSEVGGGASGAKWKKYIKMIVVRTLNAKAGAAMRIAGRRRPSAAGNTAAKATTVQPMPPK
ncbi:MAG: hypothetical protein ACLQU4_03125 [Limisphaerales bacterium]